MWFHSSTLKIRRKLIWIICFYTYLIAFHLLVWAKLSNLRSWWGYLATKTPRSGSSTSAIWLRCPSTISSSVLNRNQKGRSLQIIWTKIKKAASTTLSASTVKRKHQNKLLKIMVDFQMKAVCMKNQNLTRISRRKNSMSSQLNSLMPNASRSTVMISWWSRIISATSFLCKMFKIRHQPLRRPRILVDKVIQLLVWTHKATMLQIWRIINKIKISLWTKELKLCSCLEKRKATMMGYSKRMKAITSSLSFNSRPARSRLSRSMLEEPSTRLELVASSWAQAAHTSLTTPRSNRSWGRITILEAFIATTAEVFPHMAQEMVCLAWQAFMETQMIIIKEPALEKTSLCKAMLWSWPITAHQSSSSNIHWSTMHTPALSSKYSHQLLSK